MFPDKLQLTDIKNEEYEENSFVRKIKDIEYDEVIPEAVDDYVHTVLLIEQELRESLAIRTQFEEYEKSVERRYRTEYRKACRINEIREPLKGLRIYMIMLHWQTMVHFTLTTLCLHIFIMGLCKYLQMIRMTLFGF